MPDSNPANEPRASAREATEVRRGVARALDEDHQLVIEEIVTESIAAAPDGSYPAGSGVTITLTAGGQRGSLTLLSAGYSSSAVAWLSRFRIEVTRATPEAAHLLVDRVTDRVLASQPIQIRKGQSVRLHDRVELAFQGHGHKSISAGMESPLMVYVEYDGSKQETYSLFPPRETTWAWQDLRFTLGKFQYDDSMELVVDRLVLEPVRLGD